MKKKKKKIRVLDCVVARAQYHLTFKLITQLYFQHKKKKPQLHFNINKIFHHHLAFYIYIFLFFLYNNISLTTHHAHSNAKKKMEIVKDSKSGRE